MQNVFSQNNKYFRWQMIMLAGAVVVLTVVVILFAGIKGGIVLSLLPFLVYWMIALFEQPRIGLITLLVVNYFVMGVSRYVPAPLGLLVDGILVMTYIALIFKRANFRPALRDLTLLAAIWYLYALIELFNPEAVSHQAWFYAMRGYALYFVLTVPLMFILFNSRRYLDLMLKLWSIFTIIALVKGLVQLAGYLDPYELQWLSQVGAKTHIVAGKLRIFSFFTDAGQYGAAMAMSGVVFSIVAAGVKGRTRWYYIFVAACAFVGMFISGTRGAIAVPAAGFLMYVLLSGRAKSIITILVLMGAVFVFFKYTNIGNSNYQIARMRTAFTGRDASLQARLNNQAKLATYLESRPFGGGIGSSGNWGTRFTPNTFLAQTPTDSWYVAIWAEQGIVGLSLYLFVILYVLVVGAIKVRRIKDDDELSYKLKALLCGIAGVAAASYSNGVIGQMPTGIIVYMSMAFVFMSSQLKDEKSLISVR